MERKTEKERGKRAEREQLIDKRSRREKQKLSRERYSHRRSCGPKPVSHTQTHTHVLSSLIRPTHTHTHRLASDWTQVAPLTSHTNTLCIHAHLMQADTWTELWHTQVSSVCSFKVYREIYPSLGCCLLSWSSHHPLLQSLPGCQFQKALLFSAFLIYLPSFHWFLSAPAVSGR